ncbi:MAG: CBS domain-containing protein [Planctomycetes bacterium]|nr:CBS domain-containing protein [Planctomycetota bacterium]
MFQHSVDTRAKHEMQRGARPRVHFGDDWIKESVVEIFKEDIARFRIVLAAPEDEDSLAAVDAGRAPSLPALRLHNGTVYRWNRACYGVQNGIAHLRIENRVLPAGPTVIDEVANAAFFFGLMAGFAERTRDIRDHLRFTHVKDNFLAAARHGLKAQFTWFGGEEVTARDLILKSLLPIAREGLQHAGLDMGDVDRYLGVLEARVASGQTGAAWSMASFEALEDGTSVEERCRTLTSGMLSRQLTGKPIHEWSLVESDEATDWREGFRSVGQFMKTELFTVRPNDLVDFAAAMMDWEHIRHVPVEDGEGSLVGLVSHRSLLRLIGRGMNKDKAIVVAEIMKRDPLTVTPETPSLEAIRLMRDRGVGCLPVVDEGKLVGLVTASDFLDAAVKVFEQQLREVRDA